MDSNIIPGIFGGVMAVIFATIVTRKTRRKFTNGELYFSATIWILAAICFIFTLVVTWIFFNDKDIYNNTAELVSAFALIVSFCLASFFFFNEYYQVTGKYDDDKIEFYTPWTGHKEEQWRDIKSAQFNSIMYWYVLTFESGVKMRISAYMNGHGGILDILEKRGFQLEKPL